MKWLKSNKILVDKDDINSDLFNFDDTQESEIPKFLKTVKEKKQLKTTKEQEGNLKELSESIKDFKRNNVNKTGKTQKHFNFSENIDVSVNNIINGTKKGLSRNNGKITQEQIEILKKCKEENTATELRVISKRTNKSKFKVNVLDPLIHFGFFELTIPESPTSPNQKYRLTGKFIRRIEKN